MSLPPKGFQGDRISNMTIEFPRLPLICLDTAKETNTHEMATGHYTVIDFWTTRCTNCPDALDKLEHLASLSSKVNFVSICCDSLDGAREIIERNNDIRWPSVHHYFMEYADKELCKQIFGFKRVPFYIVLNEKTEITQYGNTIDWDPIHALIGYEKQPESDENARPRNNLSNVVDIQDAPLKARTIDFVENNEDEFIIEDLDF